MLDRSSFIRTAEWLDENFWRDLLAPTFAGKSPTCAGVVGIYMESLREMILSGEEGRVYAVLVIDGAIKACSQLAKAPMPEVAGANS